MNKRTIDIIKEFSKQNNDLTLDELAHRYSVTKRTIRNDIDEINNLLDDNQLNLISYGKGGSIVIPGDFVSLLSKLGNTLEHYYQYSSDERRLILSAILASASGFVSADTLAERVGTSRSTVFNDMGYVEAMLSDNFLELLAVAGKGFLASGEEAERRSYLLAISSRLYTVPGALTAAMPAAFDGDTPFEVAGILSKTCQLHGMHIRDAIFQYIVRYLSIACMRIRDGHYLEHDTARALFDRGDFVSDIANELNNTDILFGNSEKNFFAGVLAEYNIAVSNVFQRRELNIQIACRSFIEKVSGTLDKDLTEDYILFESLSMHLESTFGDRNLRLEDSQEVQEVIIDNPEIARAVAENCGVLEAAGGRKLTNIEKSYIVIHVCAAIERRERNGRNLNVVIACNAGLGTSQLLLESLKNRFSFNIVRVIPAHEAGAISGHDADLVISTVPLSDCSVDSVVISAIPHERDFQKVSEKISELSYLTWHRRNSSNLSDQEAFVSLESAITKIGDLLYREFPERYYQLMPEVDTILRSDYCIPNVSANHNDGEVRLFQLLTKEFIELNVNCADWKDSIKASGKRLVEGRYCSKEYVDATIKNIEELGPYIVISKGFALPHESADKGAHKLGLSLIRLNTPVCFGVEELDPVRYVCMLTTIDDTAHLRALFDLMNCLQNPEFLTMLDNAKTPEEAAWIVREFEMQEQINASN